jgi:hypothetical protein
MTAVPAGVALAASVLAAAPANAADTAGSPGPIKAFGGPCLDVQGANTADFTPVQVYGCNGTGAQQWTVDTDGNTLQALGKCLDVQYGGTADGTPVDLYDCNGTGAQVWIPQNNGSFYNPQSNKCLDDTNWSTTPGTQAQIWDCDGAANQSWTANWQWNTSNPPSMGRQA